MNDKFQIGQEETSLELLQKEEEENKVKSKTCFRIIVGLFIAGAACLVLGKYLAPFLK